MVWQNWARNQRARPARVEDPASEAELVACVRRAREAGQRLRVVGAGHSFTGLAAPRAGDRLLRLDRWAGVESVDRERLRVRVRAGTRLFELNEALAAADLALPNLGDIAYQAVAGATETATHGTGARLGNLATNIVGMQLVDGRGSLVTLDEERDAERLRVARVGLGALGVISTLTLQCVPRFRLHAREGAERLDALLSRLDEEVDGNQHFEFFWVPHTGWALTKRNNRSERPPAPRPRWRALRDDLLYGNVLFGLACRAGVWSPERIPRLVRLVPGAGPVEYVDRSDRVFASPRWVRFLEMEYAIPRAAAAEALGRVRALVKERGFKISFPVEVRFAAADDVPLSPAYGRESCYIAVHIYHRTPAAEADAWFRAVEGVMDDYGGRPHWGKLHFQDAETLAPRYPDWDAFGKLRQELDPDRTFANAELERVLGP